jgi:hypothetical protein
MEFLKENVTLLPILAVPFIVVGLGYIAYSLYKTDIVPTDEENITSMVSNLQNYVHESLDTMTIQDNKTQVEITKNHIDESFLKIFNYIDHTSYLSEGLIWLFLGLGLFAILIMIENKI